jgi:demethylmenaquinone methyltransferase/2-methoxy-6-polyprenyl-1,4-benzoquinol methylase
MPPVRLRVWPRAQNERTAYVDDVFRRVAPRYDRLTRLLSFGGDRRWKRDAVSLLPPLGSAGRVLDLATGTADFPVLIRSAGGDAAVTALDRSGEMLALGVRKCAAVPGVRFVRGDLNRLPFPPATFDAVLFGYGWRYFDDLEGAARSLHALLKPGGTLVTLDFGVPRAGWYRRLCFAYLLVFGTLWGLVLHGRLDTYWHIVESLRAWPGQNALAKALERAGFGEIAIVERLGGISVLASAERT